MSFFLRLNFVIPVLSFAVFYGAASASPAGNQEEKPFLHSIIVNGDSVIRVPPAAPEREMFFRQKFVFASRNNSILFRITSAANPEMQYFLDGFDRKWTAWNQYLIKEYTNLPAGIYTFKARYRDPGGKIEEISPFTFKVLPLWYSSKPAVIFYLLLFVLLIWALYNQMNLRNARTQYMLEQIVNKRTDELIAEKEKTGALLANVLPKNTADEIMAKGKAAKIKYNFVTVLFSDIQGFTKIAEEMNPEVLIDELDKFFFHFDSVVEKFGIEKIKTIGDAYMCAGGIPEKNRTNPVEVILAALEMKAYMTRLKNSSELEGMKFWDIRIGIHTGTVIAGVVGQKKLSYDIWGDTVNTASRMESSGAAGKINISGTTYEFVKDFFSCEYRGKMPVKYKGELEMYFVNSIRPELSDENGGPNRKFRTKMQMIKLQDIEEFVVKMFDDEAPPNLYFHNSSLLKAVCSQVDLLSTAETLPDEEYVCLKLASIFLFTGYFADYDKPMEASVRLAGEILTKYGFDRENIESATRLINNSYTGQLESLTDKILHDARYDYMGRVDYLKLTDKLLRELTEFGKHSDTDAWIDIQEKELREHEFITGTAKLLRNIQVEDQIAALRASLS
jgi:adenylate cyclase